jgi:hypothetical protein
MRSSPIALPDIVANRQEPSAMALGCLFVNSIFFGEPYCCINNTPESVERQE